MSAGVREPTDSLRVRALQATAVLEISQGRRELGGGVLLEEREPFFRQRAVQDVDLLSSRIRQFHPYSAAVLLVPHARGKPGRLYPIEGRRHGTACEAGRLSQRARAHRPGSRQHAQTAQVGSIQLETPGDRFVDFVGGLLKG